MDNELDDKLAKYAEMNVELSVSFSKLTTSLSLELPTNRAPKVVRRMGRNREKPRYLKELLPECPVQLTEYPLRD